MTAALALSIWLVMLLGLLRYERAKEPGSSAALWLSVLWIAIVASRLPSQWMGGGFGFSGSGFEEGNALDRNVYFLLIFLMLCVLQSRSFDWKGFFTSNLALTALLAFALTSVLWSDAPFISFKRWFRDIGAYLAILVALSDPRGRAAAHWVFRRVFYLLIPLSIVLIKYYPEIAREFDQWTGKGYFTGASTSKNMLGVLCLVAGLFFLHELFSHWRGSRGRRSRRVVLSIAFLAMTGWLLSKASSATSTLCLALGALIIVLAHTSVAKRRPGLLTVGIPITIGLYLLLQFGLGIDIVATVSQAVGRNPDLTGRTNIWSVVLSAGANPIVGAGYESFWLGDRLLWVWERAGQVNQAHNGYLETYLNLGIVGLALLVLFLLTSYRKIAARFRQSPSEEAFTLALWAVLLFYNVTEAAFRGHLMWIAFVLSALVVPSTKEQSPLNGRREMRPIAQALGRSRFPELNRSPMR